MTTIVTNYQHILNNLEIYVWEKYSYGDMSYIDEDIPFKERKDRLMFYNEYRWCGQNGCYENTKNIRGQFVCECDQICAIGTLLVHAATNILIWFRYYMKRHSKHYKRH